MPRQQKDTTPAKDEQRADNPTGDEPAGGRTQGSDVSENPEQSSGGGDPGGGDPGSAPGVTGDTPESAADGVDTDANETLASGQLANTGGDNTTEPTIQPESGDDDKVRLRALESIIVPVPGGKESGQVDRDDEFEVDKDRAAALIAKGAAEKI